MKKTIYTILVAVIIAGAFSSCKKFLERPPAGQMTEEEALKDEAGFMALLNGEYTLLANNEMYGGRLQTMAELLADEVEGSRFTGDFSEIFRRQNSIFGGFRDAFYNNGYRVINVANLLLSKMNLIGTAAQDNAKGQLLLFRAMGHFEMVRFFAQPYGYTNDNSHDGIPLRNTVLIASVQRSPVAAIYNQIISDLKEAEQLLPDTYTGNYKATKWAAKAFLAKVYFQMNDFANAYSYASQVVANPAFVLDAAYNLRFSPSLSKEGIFTIQNVTNYYSPGGELRGNYRSDLNIPVLNYTTQFYNFATQDPADVRKAWYSSTLQTDYKVLTKYNRDVFDLPIIHLTEIKLILAESGAEIAAGNAGALSAAITNINEILTRAYGGTSHNLGVNATAGLVITTARKERELEMVGEGNRYHEIKRIGARNGTSVDRRGSPWNCNGFILQFPKAEQDAMTSFKLNPEGGCF